MHLPPEKAPSTHQKAPQLPFFAIFSCVFVVIMPGFDFSSSFRKKYPKHKNKNNSLLVWLDRRKKAKQKCASYVWNGWWCCEIKAYLFLTHRISVITKISLFYILFSLCLLCRNPSSFWYHYDNNDIKLEKSIKKI